ncbi:PAK4-inhibitor INKA2 isoform X1 [Gadus morhua]|uniref:PAK4-inhibitor INKA2 n=1 Tax=Gadus morhua TaxID=8049 RepID=A0A8C5AYL7_GADMO|nr:PAK4-inhibitor INKA2 isoform X1 [Gadus morhua]
MEQQLSKPERKNMDACLRRLKQELVSMKEAGDGLHAQMNSMMGALQELKLLQVQTALESLDISGRPINRGPPPATSAPPVASSAARPPVDGNPAVPCRSPTPPEEVGPFPGLSPMLSPRPSPDSRVSSTSQGNGTGSRAPQRSSVSSSSSLGRSSSSEGTESPQRSQRSEPEAVPRRWSGYTAPQVDFCGPTVGNPPPEPVPHPLAPRRSQVLDLPGILYSLSREGPSLDSDYSQDSMDDSSDWTSSLMSQRRNRQPLVLGDNVFADLVGNWLDLPELERGEEEAAAEEEEVLEEMRKRRGERITDRWPDRPDSPAHPLRLSKSQEISKKFSLTTNIFKKFLRSVRPDRDKLLKERPGWVAPEHPEGDLSKRPKKAAPKSNARGSFYLPFWAAGQLQQQQQQGKGRPGPQGSGLEKGQYQPRQQLHQQHHPTFSGIYLDRNTAESRLERTQPLFDHNTAVWV